MEFIETAPAKINLGLNVREKRSDGYHELETVMTSIDLSDRITVSESSDPGITLSSNSLVIPLNRHNHAYQAAKILQKKFTISSGVNIYIDKKIPIGAGLAGGSTDCAATLRALNKLWDLNLSIPELAEIGSEIGSDVPYCIYGGTALATGRGEIIEPLANLPHCWVILVKPRKNISTARVFRIFDILKAFHPKINSLKEAVNEQDFDQIAKLLGNSLEGVASQFLPEISKIKEKLIKLGCDGVVMTGSGSAVFGLCKKFNKAKRIYDNLKSLHKEVYLVRSL